MSRFKLMVIISVEYFYPKSVSIEFSWYLTYTLFNNHIITYIFNQKL